MNSTAVAPGTKQLATSHNQTAADNSSEVTKRSTVRSIKPASFADQPKSNVLKTNIKGMLNAQVTAQTKRTNYGERQKHRNRNVNLPGQALPKNQPSARAYASTKPSVRLQQTIEASKNEVTPSLDVSQRQGGRAQSRRNVPSHLFHPQANDLTHDQTILSDAMMTAEQYSGSHIDSSYQLYGTEGAGGQSESLGPRQQKNKTLKISRDCIQAPPQQQNQQRLGYTQNGNVRGSQATTRKGSTFKRHSIMSDNAAIVLHAHDNDQSAGVRQSSTTSRNNDHNESAKYVQHRLRKQMANLNNLGSLDNLNVIAEIGDVSIKQRNSSLLRDQSITRRRKSSSNPRQKLGSSNLRTMQIAQGGKKQTTARVQIGHKYGYKHGGPIEAYQTAHPQDQESVRAKNATGKGIITKKISTNQMSSTIQTSQEVNPLNLQHLSSIERTGSIDSAGYELNSMQVSTKAGRPMIASTGYTPKTGIAYDTIQSRDSNTHAAVAKMNPVAHGFSEMLKQTIISKAKHNQSEQIDSDIEAAILSLNQSHVTQNLMKEFINARNETEHAGGLRKGSLPSSISDALTRQQSSGNNSRLENLIQQLIVRKEITQSPHIQQRRVFNQGAATAAHHSLQAPDQLREHIAGQQNGMHVTSFTNSLHDGRNGALLKAEFSAEDLLRIGRNNAQEAALQQSPQKKVRGNDLKPQMPPKTFRAGTHGGLATFGDKNGITGGGGNMNQQCNVVNHTEEMDLTDTFGAAVAGKNGQNTQQIAAQAFSAISNSDTKETHQYQGETQKAVDLYSDLYRGENNRHKFLSLDQPHKTTMGSEGSIDDIYHKTLSAYQNDINQLNEINRTKKEISNRLMKHQNLLQSIQGAAKAAPSSASAVLIDSVGNGSTVVQSKQQSVIGHHQQVSSKLDTNQNLAVWYNQFAGANSQGAQVTNQSTIINNLDFSQRGSFIDPASSAGNVDGATTTKGKMSSVTTSPIVGRYRLKHIQNPQNKRQHAYDAAHSISGSTHTVPSHLIDKRTRSVRPKRPPGQQLAGGSNLRGGGRKGEQKQSTTGTQVRNKFDSIAMAYNSNTMGREDYATNSQRSFAGLGLINTQQPTQQPTQQQNQQMVLTKRQNQTLDSQQQKQNSLQQTYGVAQKLQGSQNTNLTTAGGKRSTVASVPRQRQGPSFSSNLRPPVVKTTERSLSHNRNRGQQSFQHTNSFVAQHTYMSANSGITGYSSQGGNRTISGHQHLNGSVQYPVTQGFNPNVSDTAIQDTLLMQSAISPISTAQNRSFKYRPKQAAAQTKRTAKKSTSRGRGAIVANSTQLVGPGGRKQSRITQWMPHSKEIKQTQLSQQQVQQFRGSLVAQQNQKAENRSFRLSSGHSRDKNHVADSRLSPNPTLKETSNQRGLDVTPDHLKQKSPLRLINKISRKNTPDRRPDEEADLSGQMSVGGQDIGPNTSVAAINAASQGIPLTRTHNLRYSSTVNDFGAMDQAQSQPATAQKVVRKSDMSIDAQDRQNQAMKLINEDNPFEKPSPAPLQNQSISKLVINKGDSEKQIMSIGDESNKSIAEKTTERESKNTNLTFAGQTISGAVSGGTLSNQFGFSKQSQNRRIIIGGPTGSNAINVGIAQRRSLLGLAAMRRSETTEDSQQCMYNDSNIIMSSLPMPMESIKQVIAEEEAAEEQDERTTNKESSKVAKKAGQKGGNTKSSSSNKDKVSSEDYKRQLSSPMILTQQSEKSIRDETNVLIVDDSDSVRHSDSNNVVILESGNIKTPQPHNSAKDISQQPLSQKQSDRYSERGEDHRTRSEAGNMLCDSATSVQYQAQIDDSSGLIGDIITPDLITTKDSKVKKANGTEKVLKKPSYNRGAFWSRSNQFIDEWPAPLSESSVSAARKKTGSEAHSDDEIEVRRGLESEHVRTDMGSNPELLRQSTHSLLHKPTQAKEEKDKFGDSCTADMLVMKKKTKHADESNDNLISDEINVDLSRSSHISKRIKDQQTRNNNYFSEAARNSSKKSIKRLSLVDPDEDEEEELIVGQVDDAEEFKLGKII